MITVLLASYNGERYIEQQLDSLLEQTYGDFKILISDDGSKDGTLGIIKDYIKRYPNKICLLEGEPTGSAKKNFMKLLNACNSEYMMFCDQDDYWNKEKIEITYKKMQELEAKRSGLPLLVHTDLFVADAGLNIISESFFEYQKISPDRNKLENVLVQNNVTGCTVMINKRLADMLKAKTPQKYIMHDWWINIIATAFGTVDYINQPTMYYRQHSDNEVGAKNATGMDFLVSKIKNIGKVKKNYYDSFSQAKSFAELYKNELSAEQLEIVNAFASLADKNMISKINTINKYGFKKNTFLRVAGQYFLM